MNIGELAFDPGEILLDGVMVNPVTLARISMDKIDQDMRDLPANLVHLHALSIGINDKISELTYARKQVKTTKYESLRDSKKDKGLTEQMINNTLEVDPDIKEIDEKIKFLESNSRYVSGLIDGVNKKHQNLLVIGSRRTEELRSTELSVGRRV